MFLQEQHKNNSKILSKSSELIIFSITKDYRCANLHFLWKEYIEYAFFAFLRGEKEGRCRVSSNFYREKKSGKRAGRNAVTVPFCSFFAFSRKKMSEGADIPTEYRIFATWITTLYKS